MFPGQEAAATAHSAVLAACSRNGLSSQERDKLLKEFFRGRAHLFYLLDLKLSFWTAMPHCLAVAGHHDLDTAREGLAHAIQIFETTSPCDHPLAICMCHPQGRLFRDVQCFIRTGEVTAAFQAQRARFKMLPVAERSVERVHRLVKFATQKAPHHTAPLISLALRMPEIEQHLEGDESGAAMLAFAEECFHLHNPPRAAEVSLGSRAA